LNKVSSQVYYLKQLRAAGQCFLMDAHAWVIIKLVCLHCGFILP